MCVTLFAFKSEGKLDRVPKNKLWTKVSSPQTNTGIVHSLLSLTSLHLNIIAQIFDTESGEMQFFMPSALVCAPDDFLIVLEVRSDSVLVCFIGGYSPRGLLNV